jgi:hypothetical protein
VEDAMGFDKWDDRLPKDEALEVIDNAQFVSDGTHEKDTFWRGYKWKGKFFIGLCDGDDIWETDEQTMRDHCCNEGVYVEDAIEKKDKALGVIALNPKIRAWLEKNDPMALRQVLEALKA